ncbi:hypothetical protein AWR27_07090 [Spirosoma montaniterrae]|uniref:Uncharacterized protein n=2 Tax=Spirosoma montaniterrae TaxID=1178516 RepID=A0A1P9WUN3_9BACT|nr:hypothetical protein AWR27_07090 [Spirosoma montaniterrae]
MQHVDSEQIFTTMQVLKFRHIENQLSHAVAGSWLFLRDSFNRFIAENAQAFEALSRQSTPHGGNVFRG